MTREYGTLVINGVTLKITNVYLRNGEVHFVGTGTVNRRLEGPITVFGEDGIGLFQGSYIAPKSYYGVSMTMDLPLRISAVDEIETENA